MKKLTTVLILAVIASLFLPFNLSAAQRGISVKAKTGKSLYLYKDYHALVVGISNYEKWTKLPNATRDAKVIASKLEKY